MTSRILWFSMNLRSDGRWDVNLCGYYPLATIRKILELASESGERLMHSRDFETACGLSRLDVAQAVASGEVVPVEYGLGGDHIFAENQVTELLERRKGRFSQVRRPQSIPSPALQGEGVLASKQAVGMSNAYTRNDVRDAMLTFCKARASRENDYSVALSEAMFELFKELGVEAKLSLLPESRYGDMIALAERKMAELPHALNPPLSTTGRRKPRDPFPA